MDALSRGQEFRSGCESARAGRLTAIFLSTILLSTIAQGQDDPNFTRKGTDKEWAATPENVARLKMHLVELIGMITGGPQKYTGRSMKESHAGMKITAEEFGALAADLKATLDKFKVPTKEQTELFKIVGSTQGDIVEVR